LISRNIYLILASGEINGIGFWLIDKIYNEYPTIENKDLIECHRKELVAEDSAREILYAINFNVNNIINNLKKEGFNIDKPPKGISFNLPLDLVEDIFDFWLETYKDKNAWQTALGLLKMKKRISLKSIIISKAIKNHVKDLAYIIEKLHTYRPCTHENYKKKDPMWK
tara:strand:+ start:398 stop:901 length:504 start_codon:yes stop_codon:yes gene_type:complete